jgi:signal transduction histidine kinase
VARARTDPLLPYRLKTVRAGINSTLLALTALLGFRLLPGHGHVPDVAFTALVAAAGIGILLISSIPWSRLFEEGRGLRLMLAWSAADIALVTAAIGITGGGRSDLYLLYVLTTAFFGFSFQEWAQAALLSLTLLSYLWVLALTGWQITAAVLAFRLAVVVTLAFLVAFVARELMRQMAGHHEARGESERRASLLESVAVAARGMSALAPNEVLKAVVEAAGRMGFETAAVGVYDSAGTYRTLRTVRVPEAMVDRPTSSSEGLVSRVWLERETVATEDYPSESWAIPEMVAAGINVAVATPVWSQGELVAALVCASAERRQVSAQEIEAIELLAAQTGAALHIAHRFEAEHQAVERLAELDRLKSDFLSSVSHELRTPLTVIIGNGKTLSGNWKRLDENLKLELLRRLNANAVSLESIITSLLDFSRLEAGHVSMRVEAFDLGPLLEATSTRLVSLFADRKLTRAIEPGLAVLADATLIDRVVENLLVNASKYTPPGGRVVLSAHRNGEYATVAVSDNGPGIPVEDVHRLGERFFRGAAVGGRSRGTGLGLALVREVLELHGSALQIASRLDVGSRFWFDLPLATRGGAPSEPEGASPGSKADART